MVVRGMDLFHVSIAIEVAADGFLSFDDEQSALAEATGLPLVRMSSEASRSLAGPEKQPEPKQEDRVVADAAISASRLVRSCSF
jgi:uncharacterized protein YbjT (DUF2867 family)